MSTTKSQYATGTHAMEPMPSQQQHPAPYGSENSVKLHSNRQLKGAAVAGGVTGLVLIGPATGLLAAGGAVLAASSKGKVGEVARATGDSVSDLGRSLKKFDRKHSITEKTSKGIVKGCNWVSKKLDKEKRPKI